ncbi:MAG: hypothetical protein ACI9DG_001024 [Oleispira sp.]|jgi:hypothetical protein
MKKALLATLIIIFSVLGFGSWYLYQWVRDELDLDNGYVAVVGIPAGNKLINHPAYSGPHPKDYKRPKETFPFPIEYGATGPVEPLFAGTNQYPFVCDTERSKLGQPLIDNTRGWGVPVYAETKEGMRSELIIGYSKDCSLPTRIFYAYNTQAGSHKFYQVPDSTEALPNNAELIIRMETGTINRYMYAMLMPSSRNDELLKPDLSKWNGKLIYYFRGGIGIGFQQGVMRMHHLSKDMRQYLEKGYAIVFSTANETGNGYNIWLQEDTALRLKRNFSLRFREPTFTIGYGGSGGAIQQYLLSQNNPGAIIDGGVAIVAYPDMASQINYTLDCELTEYYFEHLSSDKAFWRGVENRPLIQGLAGNPNEDRRLQWLDNIAQLLRFEWPDNHPGANECNSRWRGSLQYVNNPVFNPNYTRFSKNIRGRVFWTHWQDNREFFGTDESGRAPIPWSNEGVQYGLKALQNKAISPQQFIDINSKIGGWLPQENMTQERYWHASGDSVLKRYTSYSEHNMTHHGKSMNVAPRSNASHGNIAAAKGAYWSGNIFLGELKTPIIDIRPYQDKVLDIHHSWSALSSRKRIQQRVGNHQLQVIWQQELPNKDFSKAVYMMDDWLTRAHANGGHYRVARPKNAIDTCFDKKGEVLHQGETVWDGEWNGKAQGACTQLMPFYQGSRNVAGEDISSDIFFCSLISVREAMNRGFYGEYDMGSYQGQLEKIFNQGVCDYSKPDRGRPAGL